MLKSLTDNQYKWNFDELTSRHVQQAVARGLGKRSYLDDCKPLMFAFSAKNISTQVLKAAIIPANMVLAEYNKHLIDTEQRGVEDEEFDWKTCLEKNFLKFQLEAQRMLSVSIFKKIAEEVAIHTLPIQYADKLTKDVSKSMMRKAVKFNRMIASKKIFATTLWANAFSYGSLCLYDITYRTCEYVWQSIRTCQQKGLSKAVTSFPFLKWLEFSAKKIVFFGLCWLSSSGGYSLGSLADPKYGGMVGSLLMELITAASCGPLLGL